MNRWPEREPTLADRLLGWMITGFLWFATAYFGAHFLVAQGVGCP